MKTCPKIKYKSYMYNNISNFFRNLYYYLSCGVSITFNLPKVIKNQSLRLRLFINDQILKYENIVETNIDLGKYHLRLGNMRDAIIRFRIARFFFGKENPEIHYWLGWCYFLKGKYEKASESLKAAGKSDEVKLGEFIKNADTLTEVPREIWEDVREISLCEGNEKYFSKDLYNNNIDLPQEMIEFFLNTIEEMINKPKILDYGCGTGLAGSYLDYKIDKEYKITAVDSQELCLDYIKHLRGERGYVYDTSHRAYLDNPDRVFNNQKYDIILSFDALGFTKDLTKIFKAFQKNLGKEGVIAILLPSSKITMWDKARRTYSFNMTDIVEQLKLAKLNFIDIKEWSLGKNKKYCSIIARK